MKKLFILTAIILSALSARALNITISAGQLQAHVSDLNITELKISGAINAVDIEFINTSLTKLQTLDISGAQIVNYTTTSPDGVVTYKANTIPRYGLFMNKSIVTLVMPRGLKVVGDGAFAGCEKLKSITWPTALDSIGVGAFNSCKALTTLVLPSTVRKIGVHAFSRSALKAVTILPNSSFSISRQAFLDCRKLTTLRLGPNVAAIEAEAFAGCTALLAPTIDSGSNLRVVEASAFEGSGVKSLDFLAETGVTNLGNWAFASSGLTSASVPASVTETGDGLLFNNPNLQSFSYTGQQIPAMFAALDRQANLSTAIAPNVTHIGAYAFYNNTATTDMTIPANVRFIGDRAMAGMTGLQSLTADPMQVPSLGEDVWEGVVQPNVTLTVDQSVVDDYSNTPQWMEFTIKGGGLLGDVNLDGHVNVGDVTAIYSVILGISMEHESRANINGDNIINVADVSAEYIILITGNSPAPAAYMAKLGDNNDNLQANDIDLTAGHEAVLVITLDNETAYNAFQMDIDMPRGLSVTDVTLAERTQAMTLGFREMSDGLTRVVAYNEQPVLESGSGAMLLVTVTADNDFNGDDLISLRDILLVEQDVTCHYLDQININATATTGIKNVNSDLQQGPVDVYNIQGQLLRRQVDPAHATEGLPSGIYIVGGKKIII